MTIKKIRNTVAAAIVLRVDSMLVCSSGGGCRRRYSSEPDTSWVVPEGSPVACAVANCTAGSCVPHACKDET